MYKVQSLTKVQISKSPQNLQDSYEKLKQISKDFKPFLRVGKVKELDEALYQNISEYSDSEEEKVVKPKSKYKRPAKRVRKSRTSSKSKPKPKTKSKSTKPRKTKSKKEKLVTPPDWLMFIRKFVSYYANKSIKVETLTKYIEALQDKFQANPNRKPTPNIEFLREIQSVIVKTVNKANRDDKVKVEISSSSLNKMKEAINNYTVARGNERIYPEFENRELSGLKKKL